MKRALVVLLASIAVTPAAARADGLPVLGLDGNSGVVSRDGAYRYVTFPNGRGTIVSRIHVDGGSVARYRMIDGRFAIPAVAYDNTSSGLSADGGTLVLIRPRTGLAQKRTQLAVVDPVRLLVQRHIVLRGDFSFDAISPDGSKVYLVNYLSLSRHNFDPTDYKVRSLDTATGKLDPRPVVDPREPDEKMGGLPVTRAMSADGRWAYTLYSGSEHPFVHALDTVGNSAHCIDLDALKARDDLFQMKLQLTRGGHELRVVKANKPVVLVDTRTFSVTRPRRVAAPPAPASSSAHHGALRLWPYALALVAFVLLAIASARPRARTTRAR
jgi:DNA-binding beta-propeller fold protein YncE